MKLKAHSHLTSRRRHLRLLALLGSAPLAMLMPGLRPAHAGAFDDFFKAARIDDANTIRSLLQRGFDPNTVEPERGDTAMILALREGSMKVFDLLLNARGINFEIRTRNGDNAMMIAAYKGNLPAVKALIAKGAEVNRTDWTPLHYAAFIGNNEIVKLLLAESAYIDAESPDRTTPIMMAVRGGHIYTVKLLLDEGADATLRNAAGLTAIDLAKKGGFRDIEEGLIYRLRKARN